MPLAQPVPTGTKVRRRIERWQQNHRPNTHVSQQLRCARRPEDAARRTSHLISVGQRNARKVIRTMKCGDCGQHGVNERGNLNRLIGSDGSLMIPLTVRTGASRTRWQLGCVSEVGIGQHFQVHPWLPGHVQTVTMQIIATGCPSGRNIAGQNSEQAQRQQTAAREESTGR